MHNFRNRGALSSVAGVLALLLFAAFPSSAQNERQTRYAIERAQVGVKGKIVEERGGDWGEVTFDQSSTQTWRVSDRQTGVRGRGTHAPNGSQARQFTYEAVVDHRNGKIESVNYDFGRGGGGNGGGWNDRRVPRWLVGTFYGRSPSNGRRVELTVTRDGEATAVFRNGSREQGTYDNGRIRFSSSSDSWDVSRVSEGVRAASGSRSEVFTTDASRGGGDDDDNDDNDGRVPRWARGTFRGTTSSGESELTIRADGTATARSLTKNQTFRGTYSNGRLRFDWGTFDVQRTGDGIRTVEVNNRSNQTDYRRTGN
ncbi:MAG TPA: hypothetical protein VNZ44_20235 [Pyrinomonadaceae bacterium]|nr:hypothetical protein [Pyrinomonadaceae bacterium]